MVITHAPVRRDLGRITSALALIVAILACGKVWAQPKEETLIAAAPSGFKVGFQTSNDRMIMIQWVRESESVENWTEMVTVQEFRSNKDETSFQFLQSVGMKWLAACTGGASREIVNGLANGYPVSMLLLHCPLSPTTKKPETVAFRVIRGNDALYSVQRVIRSEPSKDQLGEAMRYLGTVGLCDPRRPEHPCPDFNARGAQK